jgi:hypothetical protein
MHPRTPQELVDSKLLPIGGGFCTVLLVIMLMQGVPVLLAVLITFCMLILWCAAAAGLVSGYWRQRYEDEAALTDFYEYEETYRVRAAAKGRGREKLVQPHGGEMVTISNAEYERLLSKSNNRQLLEERRP